MVLVGMTRERDHDHVLAPMQQGRPAEEDPEGQDPLLIAARWTLQGESPPEDADEGED